MHDLLIHEHGARRAVRRDPRPSVAAYEPGGGASRPLPPAAEVRLRVRRPTTGRAV